MNTQTYSPSNGLHAIPLSRIANQTGGAPSGSAALSTTKRTLTTDEFAKVLGVSRKKVTHWVRSHQVRVIKGLRPYAIPAQELDRLLKGGFVNE